MKILLIGSFLILLSCTSQNDSATIEFRDSRFDLPGKVSDIKKQLNLQYSYYVGFVGLRDGRYKIGTQLEDYPIFMGSDNDSEESFYDKQIVGVTLEFPKDSFNVIRRELSNQHKSSFKLRKINSSWIKNEYWILKNDNNLNLFRKMTFFRQQAEEALQKLAEVKDKKEANSTSMLTNLEMILKQKTTEFEFAKNSNEKGKTSNDLPQGKISPIGS
jgi:hypothetical protein